MLCESCQVREATVVRSEVINGEKTVIYRCEACLDPETGTRTANPPPQFDRPCAECRQAEGDVKLTRFVNGRRVATYLCQRCATA